MFDSLSDRLGATLDGLRGKGRLTEDDINAAMREIRLALLEADVNFAVVKQFVAAVKERAMGAEVLDSLTPGQQVVKIVHEELTELMGSAGSGLSFSNRPPTVILMAGLQGSGKTTACGKLARLLAKQKQNAGDGRLRRLPAGRDPAAADPRQVAAGAGVRARHRRRPGRDGGLGDRAGARPGPGRRHRRHRRTAAHRRAADGRARAHQGSARSRTTCCSCSTR